MTSKNLLAERIKRTIIRTWAVMGKPPKKKIWGKTMNAGKEQPVYYSLVVLFNENRFYITSIKPGMRIRAREKGPVTGKDLPDTNIGIAVSEKPGIAFGHGNKKLRSR